MVLGLGVPELLFIAVIAGIFLFGAPKVKEWVDTFKSQKKAAVEIIKSDPEPASLEDKEYIPVQKVKKVVQLEKPVVNKKAIVKEESEEMEFP